MPDTLATHLDARTMEGLLAAGNLPGRVGRWEHTWCPGCLAPLIERLGYVILENRVAAGARCPDCDARIPGIFANPRGVSAPSRNHGAIRALAV